MEATGISFEYKGNEIRGCYMIFSDKCYQLKMTSPYILEQTIYRHIPNSQCQNSNSNKVVAEQDLKKLFRIIESVKSNIDFFEVILINYCHLQMRLKVIEKWGIFDDGIIRSKEFDIFTQFSLKQYYRILFEKTFTKDNPQRKLYKKVDSFLLEKIIYSIKNPNTEFNIYGRE